MSKQIRLKYDGRCVECGSRLYRGEYAAWLGRGRGVHCLTSNCSEKIAPEDRPAQAPRVYEFTTSGGTFTRCNCEDYPCCGH